MNSMSPMRTLRDTFSGAATKVGTALIPIITKLMDGRTGGDPDIEGHLPAHLEGVAGGVGRNCSPRWRSWGTTLTKDLLAGPEVHLAIHIASADTRHQDIGWADRQ